MLQPIFFALLFLHEACGLAVQTPSPTVAPFGRRDDAVPAVPTFTFGPRGQYFPLLATDPDPAGDSIQIYPTGVYDDTQQEGVTFAFGPDLRKKIKQTMTDNCKDKPVDQCRNALIPVVYNNDMKQLSKRILFSAVMAGYLLAVIVAEGLIILGEAIYLDANKEVPKNMNFEYGDLNQIHQMGGASTIAVVPDATSDPTTIIPPPPATSTVAGQITVETLTADGADGKKGDIVYHIPDDAAKRIQDFFGMMGAEAMSKECMNSQKRADRRDCVAQRGRQLGRTIFQDGPEGLMQLARPNPPLPNPGPGQEVGVPIQNLAIQGVPVVIYLYREMRPVQVYQINPQPVGLDIDALRRAAAVLAVASWVIQNFGKAPTKVPVPKTDQMQSMKEEDVVCPNDLICLDDDCGAQQDGVEISDPQAYCKKGKDIMCKCNKVTFPDHQTVPSDYMDNQYAWLEQVIKMQDIPDFTAQCSNSQEKVDNSAQTFKDKITQACNQHSDLGSSWTWTDSNAGFTWSINWDKKNGDCGFSCADVFPTFADDKTCVPNNNMVLKFGKIETDCGLASYDAYCTSC